MVNPSQEVVSNPAPVQTPMPATIPQNNSQVDPDLPQIANPNNNI